jgi:transcriptional regulator with XRE-family HTH domain
MCTALVSLDFKEGSVARTPSVAQVVQQNKSTPKQAAKIVPSDLSPDLSRRSGFSILPGGQMNKPTPNATDAHVGNKVKLLRQTRRLSQTDLGKALGLTFQQIQKYERGANRISASKLHQLAEVLQVSPDHFFKGLDENDNFVGSSVPDFGTELAQNADAIALMSAFKRIKSKDMRRVIVGMVTELAGPDDEAPRSRRKKRAYPNR